MQAEKVSSRGYTLSDVLAPDNLALAWKQVKANRGAAGIDGMEIGEFPAFMREHWENLRSKLKSGSYRPSPVRRVDIPKDGGGTRPLGIPTVLDRLIQQAIAQVLTPLYEPTFSEHSHVELEKRGHQFVRYADDFVILCRSLRAGQRILRSTRKFLAEKLKLVVNETKSRVVKLAEASFLGFEIHRTTCDNRCVAGATGSAES